MLSALMRGFFLFLVRQTLIVMSRLIEYDLKNEVFWHYQTLPLEFYRRNNTGDLMARISEDVSKVRMFLGPAIMYGLNLVVLFCTVLPIMYFVNPKLTLYTLIPLPLLSVSIYFVSDRMNKKSEAIQKSLSGMSSFVQEAFSGIRVIKAFNREPDSTKRFAQASNEYKTKSLELVLVNAFFMPVITTLIGLSVIIVIYVGGIEVLEGAISLGNIAEFILYVNMLTWPVTSLGWITSIVQRAAASQRRINEFLQTPNPIVSEKNLEDGLNGNIAFENVSLLYADTGIAAIKNISFEIGKGQSLAIIGTTGSGKSTIANLICRLYDVTEGVIKIDNINIKDFAPAYLRSQIGYVPQEVFLFSEDIKSNISFGIKDEIGVKDIWEAVEMADLKQNIEGFEDGLETMLGERGINLSGGQKQRVSIARALIRKPKILILDDCLSAVDTKTEYNILNNLNHLMEGRTSLIISHRVSSAKLADKIIVIDDGVIIEEGKHEDLLAANGIYKELFDKQSQTEDLMND